MPIVQRFFRQSLPDNGIEVREPQPLISFLDHRVVVVLGGPGIGKTTELKQAAEQEAESIVSTVGQFLADPIGLYRKKTLYLDALDEHRAELHGGASIIDAVRGRLKSLGCPKVRLSCRSEEWQQGSDVKSLIDVTNGEPLFVLEMQALTWEDIRAISAEEIEDVEAFLDGARARQLHEFLGNPETLKLYLKVYKNGSG